MRALALVVAFAAAVSSPASSRAAVESSVACHCFTNRTFDPASPAAADPYILATTRSSLLSAAYATGKGTLVQEVMSGTDPDDLWVAYWAGARTGLGPEALLARKRSLGRWKPVFDELGTAKVAGPFQKAVARDAAASELAAVAVDDVLEKRLGADRAEVAALRKAGATNAEAVLATLLAPRLRVASTEVLARFRAGQVTWGMLLDQAGVKPKEIDPLVRASIR
jgi:hypothetical protein